MSREHVMAKDGTKTTYNRVLTEKEKQAYDEFAWPHLRVLEKNTSPFGLTPKGKEAEAALAAYRAENNIIVIPKGMRKVVTRVTVPAANDTEAVAC